MDLQCEAPARARRPISRSRHDGGHVYKETTMAELTTKKRNAEPKSDFGLPDERKYPMPDKSHAANAKARATQQRKKGNLTKAEEATIDRKADRVLDT